ncbi:MAG: MBL fold metallo-hydrolase [Candidatus Azobacteroides sp.]|nr:MBL fold metallo-hydrolase [Candidatus Azobacteroides sp.]
MQVKQFEFNHIGENTYVVYDETKEAVIIDCGAYYPKEKALLKEFISQNQLSLKHLLNTHLHLDHTFGNKFIYDTYGIAPEYHRLEEKMPDLKEQASAFGIKIEDGNVVAVKYLDDGDEISFGNTNLIAILVPGHSPGSLCFYSKENNVLFTGDVLFQGSVGRSDLWGGNYQQLISGIKNKLLILPEDTVVYSGHGPATTIGGEKQNNPFLV